MNQAEHFNLSFQSKHMSELRAELRAFTLSVFIHLFWKYFRIWCSWLLKCKWYWYLAKQKKGICANAGKLLLKILVYLNQLRYVPMHSKITKQTDLCHPSTSATSVSNIQVFDAAIRYGVYIDPMLGYAKQTRAAGLGGQLRVSTLSFTVKKFRNFESRLNST